MAGNSGSWMRRGVLSVGAVIAIIVGTLGATPAVAAPAAPSDLSPKGTSVSANPILSWSRVRSATGYDVEVAATSDFANPLYEVTTTNRRATPTTQLPMSKIWWRVRTRTSSGNSGWATASFTRGKLGGPALVSPASGDQLLQPSQPPLLRWNAVTGATNYTVEVDRGATADWVDSETYSTQTTSLVLPDPQENGEYWWRVRAEIGSGQSTYPSEARSYTVGPLPLVNGASPVEANSVEEVVLEWEPVPGAVSYDVRVSTDDSFNQIIDTKVVKGTRYSPTKTYDVDDYWWQVRARNIFGKAKEWAEVQERHQFRRTWEGPGAVPELLHPANAVSPSVGDDFYYEWTPSRLATRYRLDVGTNSSFSPGTFKSCFTTQTTYTPGFQHPGKPGDVCMPGIGATYYWRVKALDALNTETATEIQGIYSDIHKFVYYPEAVEQLAPLSGTTVDVPTLSWRPALDADKYYVEVKWNGGSRSATTYSTSWTPTGSTTLDPAKGPYTWTVQAIDHHGVKAPLPIFGAGQTFDVSGEVPSTGAAPLTPLSPAPGAAPTQRFPELTWEPVAGAAYYKVWVGTAGSGFYAPLADKFPYPAATDTTDDFLAAGSYDWFVAAYDASNNQIGAGPGETGTFTVEELPAAAGQQIALSGSGLAPGRPTCTKSLETTATDVCTGMKATPVLDWEPVSGAGYYMVYLSKDRKFQNMVYGSYSDSTKIPTTTNTMWTPTEALDDSQAGVAYYWYIRPCKAPGNCAPDPLLANHAFDKRSNQVQALGPVIQNSVIPQVSSNAVTFDWVDYLETNADPTLANPITGEQPGQAARSYHVQVSTSPAFTTLVDEATVDQTTYTAFAKMYPEGQLYWRVQAIDGSGNGLAWSDPMEFAKASPKPTPLAPTGSSSTTQPFRWEPAPYAESYDLEVYRNNDTAASLSNRVVSVSSKQVAYTLTKPLPAGTTYVWRVRRVDASRNAGRWSTWTSFKVEAAAPALGSPASGSWVKPNDALFTWGATAGATSYLYERRAAGTTYRSESVRTASTAWAPTRTIATGSWEWRVSSLDASGNVIRSSGWRGFKVDATGPTVTSTAPSDYSVSAKATFKATFSERVRNVSGTTVRLYKDGGVRVTARVVLSADRRTATLDPSSKLRRNTTYTLKLSEAITDSQGNRLREFSKTVRTQ